MYERFISSSMLIGMRLPVGVVMYLSGGPDASQARGLHVEVSHVEGVVFDELATRLDLITHKGGEHLVSLGVVLGADLQQGTVLRIHRRRPQRVRVHLAKTLVAIDGDALAASCDKELHELVNVVQ